MDPRVRDHRYHPSGKMMSAAHIMSSGATVIQPRRLCVASPFPVLLLQRGPFLASFRPFFDAILHFSSLLPSSPAKNASGSVFVNSFLVRWIGDRRSSDVYLDPGEKKSCPRSTCQIFVRFFSFPLIYLLKNESDTRTGKKSKRAPPPP